MSTRHAVVGTTLGPITIVATGKAITGLYFARHIRRPGRETLGPVSEDRLLMGAGRQLTEYLDGSRRTFDLPLTAAGDAFQKSVWAIVSEIPFGQTTTYGVVADHGGTVLRVCRVLLGSHDADDAWSETFVSALRAYPELPETANVEAWLVTIAHRKAIDVLRAATRGPLPTEQLSEAPTGLGVPGAGDADLWQFVRRLPDRQRQAVAYHYVAGLPYAEIAEIIGGTVDAARRAAADGIKNLRNNYPGANPRGDHHE